MTYMMECHPSSPTNSSSTTFSSSIPYNFLSLEPSIEPRIHCPSNNIKRLQLPQPNNNKYKGVVPQPNGRWGAQLYESSKRVWVGTYDTQELAARAYDTAVVRFRGPHAATNFPIRYYISVLQLEFLTSHTRARIIDMLRAHTYHDELSRFMRARIAMNRKRRSGQTETIEHSIVSDADSLERLFEKVLTPSDVGRLHRLVIPKQYAERYLPKIPTKENLNVGGVMLSFEDKKRNKMWRFKYCYWSSSQNFVLTKGWGDFVKDRGLKSGDLVSFYTSSIDSNDKRLYIDASSRSPSVDQESCNTSVVNGGSDGSGCGGAEDELVSCKMFRLFGVDMSVNHLHKNVL